MKLQMCRSDMHSSPDMFLFIFTIIISAMKTKINIFLYKTTIREARHERNVRNVKFVM